MVDLQKIVDMVINQIRSETYFPIRIEGYSTYDSDIGKMCYNIIKDLDVSLLDKIIKDNSMYEISKEFMFEAVHRLHLMPENHVSRNLHGHTYKISVVFTGTELNDLQKLQDLEPVYECFQEDINTNFDHAILISTDDNDLKYLLKNFDTKQMVIPVPHTTCEALANFICYRFYSLSMAFPAMLKVKIKSLTLSESNGITVTCYLET